MFRGKTFRVAVFVFAILCLPTFCSADTSLRDQAVDFWEQGQEFAENLALPHQPISDSTPAPPLATLKTNQQGILGIAIGQSTQHLKETWGSPQRIDPHPLGYVWWIYNKDPNHYVQAAVKDGKVMEIYSNAPTWSFRGIQIDSSKKELLDTFPFQNRITFSYENAQVSVDNNVDGKALFMIEEQPILFYLDLYREQRVTGIRFLSKEALVKGSFFNRQFTYTGQKPSLTKASLNQEQQDKLEQSMAKQIFDLTNVIRQRYNLSVLTWNEEAARVARSHSMDMVSHQFFDHVSKTTGMDPFERMEFAGIHYKTAGENIAYGQNDGIEALEGWMNSEGHRKNILYAPFTTLGVGVKNDYYTQNFVTP
ncbi:CAP-associated domain-containing protein [Ammoniphilus resinae]|uniref:Uncharacterized protein YkwD n=1 Tax=Ammoniphilus resinae TaxID=861532 RepID=A0ABS4GVE0_9BACL|nr:CAP-associated domain-containing protein [Ammoniphilus resinae]MBP1934077.1 uncharacterized protein YkwD [Ammoniphilus resinae]